MKVVLMNLYFTDRALPLYLNGAGVTAEPRCGVEMVHLPLLSSGCWVAALHGQLDHATVAFFLCGHLGTGRRMGIWHLPNISRHAEVGGPSGALGSPLCLARCPAVVEQASDKTQASDAPARV